MVISREIAEKEVTAWLDFKRIGSTKRANLKGNIEALIGAVMDGTFAINSETFVIEQDLKFPIGMNPGITKLSYKPRIPMSSLQDNLAGVNPKDGIEYTIAHIAALTGIAKGILKGLDPEDYHDADLIAIFFAL